MFKRKKTPPTPTESESANSDMDNQDNTPADKANSAAVDSEFNITDNELLRHHGIEGIIRLGLSSAHHRKLQNRIIYGLFALCIALAMTVSFLATRTIEPRILAETPDGRIRELPLLTDPIYTHAQILSWAERCVKDIYGLNYVDWRETLQNNTFCLSDNSRQGFVGSLGQIGLLDYLTPQKLGNIYATPSQSVMRASAMNSKGYNEWIVDVPYTLQIDGRDKGRIEAVITMRIRRVSLLWRESGIWVDEYVVNPARGR